MEFSAFSHYSENITYFNPLRERGLLAISSGPNLSGCLYATIDDSQVRTMIKGLLNPLESPPVKVSSRVPYVIKGLSGLYNLQYSCYLFSFDNLGRDSILRGIMASDE